MSRYDCRCATDKQRTGGGILFFGAPKNLSAIGEPALILATINQTVEADKGDGSIRAASGAQSLRVSWQLLPNQTDPWLRLTTFNTPALPNPALDFSLALEFAVFVPDSTPDFYVTLGARETNTSAPIGANGGTNGDIEFVGAADRRGDSPLGKLITAKDQWVTVSFEIPFEPLLPFTGDG
jgi:hypothetical protein